MKQPSPIDTLIGWEVLKELPINSVLVWYKKHSRIRVFVQKGLECYLCKQRIASRAFKLKDQSGGIHIDLFTEDLIHMNVDHIKPKAKGGSNMLENLAPCCQPCNTKKADK